MWYRIAQRRLRRTTDAREGGAVAIEFALVLPILAALLMGIITVGLGYNNTLGLADGVREGSRFGATTQASGSWGSTVQQQTAQLTYLNVSGHSVVVTPAMICAQLVKTPSTVVSASTCALTDLPPANPAGVATGTCLVKVWAQIPVHLTFVIIPATTLQVKRQSVSLYERGAC
jgi:Flp pilus assembly protein TadG